MDENKNNWSDYKPITKKEYSLLRVLLFKLQALLKKNKTKDRTEDREGLDRILYDLHKRLFRNKDRIYFKETEEK